MLESEFKRRFLEKLKRAYPNCFLIKIDDNYIQGFPDTIVLNGDKWVALEFKRSSKASHRPNQDYYICKLDEASFARFVSPENQEEVMHGIQQTFGSDW